MEYGKFHDLIVLNFGEDYIEGPTGHKELRFKCPHCEELGKTVSDYKLYVNYSTMKFNCFRCGWHGRLETSELLQEGTTSKLMRELELMFESTSPSNSSEESEDEDVIYKLPSIVPSIDDISCKYLIDRGISYEDILRYNMRVSTTGDKKRFFGRIVIPNRVIAGKWTDMYSARTYIGDSPKYKNPYNSPKNKVVFNLHNIKDNCESIIICEGVLTAIAAGPDAVAVYGKGLDIRQLNQILLKHPKKLYLCYDYDTDEYNKSVDLTQYKVDHVVEMILPRLRNTRTELYWIKMPPNTDAVDVGRLVFREKYMSEALRVTSLPEYYVISRV